MILNLIAEKPRHGYEIIKSLEEHSSGLYSEVQVFNLAVLPGTAFRQEAAMHGLDYQDRPPYYVLRTPTLDMAQMAGCGLMRPSMPPPP